MHRIVTTCHRMRYLPLLLDIKDTNLLPSLLLCWTEKRVAGLPRPISLKDSLIEDRLPTDSTEVTPPNGYVFACKALSSFYSVDSIIVFFLFWLRYDMQWSKMIDNFVLFCEQDSETYLHYTRMEKEERTSVFLNQYKI